MTGLCWAATGARAAVAPALVEGVAGLDILECFSSDRLRLETASEFLRLLFREGALGCTQ